MPADKQGNKGKEKHTKDKLEKMPNGGEQTCVAYEEAKKHVIKQKGCPSRTNVGLDLVSMAPLDWSIDDT